MSVSGVEVEALRKAPFYFQDKQLLRVFPAASREVLLTFEGQRYEFVNVEGLWVVRFPEGLRWESQADMRLILDTLSNVRAAARELETAPADEDRERYGLVYPALSVEVRMQASDGILTAGPLEVGAVAPAPLQSRYAVSAERTGVYHVNQALVDDIREALRGIVRAE